MNHSPPANMRILAIDPPSLKFYSVLANYQHDPAIIVYPDHFIPSEIKEIMIEKKRESLQIVKNMCEFDENKWSISDKDNEINAYRKRKIPSYMLQQVETEYPQYITESKLSDAFKDITSLQLDVNLEHFSKQIINPEMEHILKVVNQTIKLEISVNVELVTSAKQAIKNINRKVKEKFKKGLKCRKGYQFCLKVQGLEDYMYGKTMLMDYLQTRQILRGFKSMQLLLIEIERNRSIRCPYLFPDGSEVEWSLLKDAPLFIWYAPADLTNGQQNDIMIQSPCNRLALKSKSYLKKFNKERQKEQDGDIRSNQTQSQALGQRKGIEYSGEMSRALELEVVRLTNLDEIMCMKSEEVQQSIDNGLQQPPYITYSPKDTYLNQLMGISTQNKTVFDCMCNKPHLNKSIISIDVFLYLGCTKLNKREKMKIQSLFSPKEILFQERIRFKQMKMQCLPLETRVYFQVCIQQNSLAKRVIGSCSINLFDYNGYMVQGAMKVNLWPFYQMEPRISCIGNYNRVQANSTFCQLTIVFQHYTPIRWSLKERCSEPKGEMGGRKKEDKTKLSRLFGMISNMLHMEKTQPNQEEEESYCASMDEIGQLDRILKIDHLDLLSLSQSDKRVLIKTRYSYTSVSSYLIYLLKAVDWSVPWQVGQVYQVLEEWTPLEPWDALVLLDSWMADQTVRFYAVQQVNSFTNDQLVMYMLQLVQALQFENTCFSPLAEMLLARSLASPFVVGHEFFWLLRSYLVIKPSYQRYSIILEQFLISSGQFRNTLYQSFLANNIIASISQQVNKDEKKEKTKDKKKGKERKLEVKTRLLQKLLKKQRHDIDKNNTFPIQFSLAIDPRIMVTQILHKECKLFSSKKMPLNLKLQQKRATNSSESQQDMRTIFKTGDDLRMDMVAIQLIHIMDRLWLDNGLDLRMKPYKVISTWDQTGIIQMVPHSTTISDIHNIFGGATGALDKETIIKYLEKHNPSKKALQIAQQNFLRSCAGYCVATFIMGVGDRHNGNIMVAESGHFFHIDFGHFLGNFKSKFGFKRERTFFVFSREMQHAINYNSQSNFNEFEELCCKAYQTIRKHGNVLIEMFLMMLSAGMPELTQKEDIQYLKDRMEFNLTDKEAMDMFKEEIQRSLQDMFRVFDNQIHNMKHQQGPQKNEKEQKEVQLESIEIQV